MAYSGLTSERHSNGAAILIGCIAVVFSILYFLSDAIEVVQGSFSDAQLWLTLVSEAAVPVFVVGFAMVQRSRSFGFLGDISALAYAYSYLYFTGTVVYALTNGIEDYRALTDELGPAMTVHGVVMVLAGVGFGYAVLRAGQLPAWAAMTLIAGVILVASTQTMPAGVQLVAAGVRDIGFAGMGVALLRSVQQHDSHRRQRA